MASLLKIDVSPRGDYSVSRNLGNDWLAAWQAKNPGSTVVERDLKNDPLPYVDLPWIIGAFSAPDTHAPGTKAAIALSDKLVDELLAADEVLITTPMYNFNVPAALKAWIDHIVRFDRTFNAKYEGLATGKKATVIVAAGGNYAAGSGLEGWDFFTGYIKFIFGFIGIKEVNVQFGYGTNAVNQGNISLEEYVKTHKIPVA